MRGLLRFSVSAVLVGSAFASLADAATFYTSQPIPVNPVGSIVSLTNELRAMARTDSTSGGPIIYNWSNGLADPGQDIGSMSATSSSYGSAMNANGQIAGYTNGANSHAFLYSAGQFTDIGANPLVQGPSVARDLNNQGDVLGSWEEPGTHVAHAFLYRNGTVTQIQLPSDEPIGSFSASAINNVGQITGTYGGSGPSKPIHYVYDYVHDVMTTFTVFSIYGGSSSVDMNDAGQVIGTVYSSPKIRNCFIYSTGQTSQLGFLGLGSSPVCTVHQINNSGVVVGNTTSTGNPADPPEGAWVYSNGITTKLDNAISPSDPLAQNGIRLRDAVAINDNGQIVAISYADASGVSRYYLLTPTESTDTTDYNFETDTQGWQSNGDLALSVATTTTRAFAGGSSLSINRNGIGLGRIAVSSPVATPGQKITFHLYVPEDANIDWIQPFALESGNGTWHGNWTSVEGLQLGQWNTLEVYVPADAQPLASLGVEIYATQAYGGTIYLDSVDAVSVSDTADYSFETDTQGWESNGEPIATVGRSTVHKYVGNASLSVDINNAGFASVRVLNPAAHAGQTVTFNVFLPAGAPIDWIQPFGLSDNGWYGNWVPSEYLQLGAWNTLTVQIPDDAHSLYAIGVEVYVGQPFQGTVYIDSVDF